MTSEERERDTIPPAAECSCGCQYGEHNLPASIGVQEDGEGGGFTLHNCNACFSTFAPLWAHEAYR